MEATKDRLSYIIENPQKEKRQDVYQTPTYKNPPPMPPVKPAKSDNE